MATRRHAGLGTVALVVGFASAFVWLFGSGAVFGDEAGTWRTVRAIVQTRVLGDDLVRLTEEPEKWVGPGTSAYLEMMDERGFTLVDRAGGAMMFRGRDGNRCTGGIFQFTADLYVFHVPNCAES